MTMLMKNEMTLTGWMMMDALQSVLLMKVGNVLEVMLITMTHVSRNLLLLLRIILDLMKSLLGSLKKWKLSMLF